MNRQDAEDANDIDRKSQLPWRTWRLGGSSPMRWVVLGSGLLLGVAVGLLKVEAGYHFWTDIAAGALVGTGIGTLVPLLHARE